MYLCTTYENYFIRWMSKLSRCGHLQITHNIARFVVNLRYSYVTANREAGWSRDSDFQDRKKISLYA